MFWLEATTGQWSWGMCAEDEDDPFTFTNWQQGQPDDYGKLNLNVIVTLHACNDSNSYQHLPTFSCHRAKRRLYAPKGGI